MRISGRYVELSAVGFQDQITRCAAEREINEQGCPF